MTVDYSKAFEKEVRKQSGKIKDSILTIIKEVKQAKSLNEISNCKKIKPLKNIYRIAIGDLRAFFIFHIKIENNQVFFLSLLSRGQAYNKKNMQFLQESDTE